MTPQSWWNCPSCGSVVPVSYQLEESFEDTGRALFDPHDPLAPDRGDGSLTASWMAIVRCPDDGCEAAWVLTLYPTTKKMFEAEEVDSRLT